MTAQVRHLENLKVLCETEDQDEVELTSHGLMSDEEDHPSSQNSAAFN